MDKRYYVRRSTPALSSDRCAPSGGWLHSESDSWLTAVSHWRFLFLWLDRRRAVWPQVCTVVRFSPGFLQSLINRCILLRDFIQIGHILPPAPHPPPRMRYFEGCLTFKMCFGQMLAWWFFPKYKNLYSRFRAEGELYGSGCVPAL